MKARRLAGLTVAALIVLTGCSTAVPNSVVPAANPASGPTASGLAPGAKVDAGLLVDKVSAASKNIKTYTMTLTVMAEVSGDPMKVTETGKVDITDPAKPKTDMTVDANGATFQEIQIGATDYVNMDGAWAKQKPSDSGLSLTTSDTFAQTKDAFEDAVYVGPETVNKTATDHYVVTVDGAKLGKGLSDLIGSDLGPITYDLWIDADNYPRKIAMSFGGEFSLSMTMDDINVPVSVTAPI